MKSYTPSEKIQKARIQLVTEHVFFGSIFFRLDVFEDDTCPTAWTDGKNLGYNPEWLSQFTTKQILGVFVHEIMHVILKHHLRQELNPIFKENHSAFNRAADYALNPSVLRCPGVDLPPNVCLDLAKWPDNTVEEIFDVLPQEGNDKLVGGSPGQYGKTGPSENIGDVRSFKDGKASPAEKAAAANEVDQWVQAAVMKASGAGKMTSYVKGCVKKVLAPTVHWQDEIDIMVESMCKDDYTWKRPNNRYTQQGLYLPSLFGEHTPDMVFFVDRSGSLTNDHLAQIMAEVRSIIEQFTVRVIVVYWNTGYTHHEVFEPEDVLAPSWALSATPGGGTDFSKCWDWLDSNGAADSGIDPKGIVFFTDFECRDWPKEDPGVPVIWAQVPDAGGAYTRGYDRYVPDYGSCVVIPKAGSR